MVGAVALAWRASPPRLLAYLLLHTVAAAVPVLAAVLTKTALDRLAGGAGWESVIWPVTALALAGVLVTALPRTADHLAAVLGRRVGRLATDRLYATVDTFVGLGRYEDPRFLDRLRLAGDAARITPNRVVDGLLGVAGGALTVIGFVVSLAVLSPVVAVVLVAAAVPVLVAELWLSRRRARMVWEINPGERREMFYAQLLTGLEAAKEIRLYGAGGFLRGRMMREREAADAARDRTGRVELVVDGGLTVLAAVIAGAGLIWTVRSAAAGASTVGDVSMFVAAVAGVQGALRAVAGSLALTYDSLLLHGHYEAVIRSGPDLVVPAKVPAPVASERGIVLRDVWFRYGPGLPWALAGVDLHIPAGRSLALVGRNGAGKSTLVKLLCRFYDPCRGSIRWDGVDLRDFDPAELRRRIGAVFQDYASYDLTARENIGIGDLARSDDPARVPDAARSAGIHEALERLPDGYDSWLSRTFTARGADAAGPGVLLSGGQWQRLALARALMRDDAQLMILDEPSSGLDAEAEHEIHTMLVAHRAGRTSLLISHRLGAIRAADTIAVLDAGRVAELGTHDGLVAAGGVYAHLFGLQSRGYRTDRDPAEAAAS
ncbi:ATP-binding cassette subfamily B protein [Catenuloplanes nepalensis]|uniref:ATP-binding cassette subfamily B protein n=1 Tax=Catenuloplanes nepalensis TaxID=587533 RepID=A0ABT9N559_9ACTN|nr:ABC transporter ATP-binding protein [Catenuloplanes nepalensis]MDP9798690.1 ATP-binding cassette subfamily B protein [Catenuloplanes nepalensis]